VYLTMADSPLKQRYLGAQTFAEFVRDATANVELWNAVYAHGRLPAGAVERAAAIAGDWHLLVLNEDWCGDAVNTVPILARLAGEAPNLHLRTLGRDANPDLMDAHLTNGARSIPVVIVLDGGYEERGWWGPRPGALQRGVMTEGKALPVSEKYREVRRWYARDRGATTVDEVLRLIESVAAPVAA
jgi:hypothetical protein